ncbi:Protein N-acetyltransferase, RimJ/RimL family [Hymenobacter daecheongensis DSM 21074]|uniref:Protein N-acetyltransferase, RimJ/RimL family n=1 Tax=Hymenobacter daecheongensis DSM 21074 TaxID=1121955 RepID=A0A1M6I746_9BACT|nr:GNAT family protein [Hymenobacter daecheongensis]SHJ30287.1 Protein N-acetyltransferase, RimJ/RimL family [Hymenobacter daecheongensis DSM 21074]
MIRLEYFTPADFQQLITWVKDEHLLMNWAGAMFSFPLTPGSLAWYVEDTNDLLTSDAFIYKAVDTRTGDVVGHISLGGLSRKNSSARISRVLVGDTHTRGRGIGQAMVTQVLKIGFEQLNLHRIELGVYSFNQAAIRCYQKSGLTIEGTSRDVLRHQGEYWSLVEMSMLAAEWRALHPKVAVEAVAAQ